MEIPRLSKSVVKIVQLQKDASGTLTPVTVYKKVRQRKKMSAPLRGIEKAVRHVANAQSAFAEKYLNLHEKSNQKNKDGWARDIFPNLLDAEKTGRKKLRIKRMVMN